LDLKLFQAFAMVSLLNDPITSFVFWIRSLVLLQDFAVTHNSDLRHSKYQKELESGELGGQTSPSYTFVTERQAP
jgi:hypothetical protein